jgi:hypothetical protein
MLAHMELREIRRNRLNHSIFEKLFDEAWCMYYLNYLGYSNSISKVYMSLRSHLSEITLKKSKFGDRLRSCAVSGLIRFNTITFSINGISVRIIVSARTSGYRKQRKVRKVFALNLRERTLSLVHKRLNILPYAAPVPIDQLNPKE